MTIEVPYITIAPLRRCTFSGCHSVATHELHFDNRTNGFSSDFVTGYCFEHANDLLHDLLRDKGKPVPIAPEFSNASE